MNALLSGFTPVQQVATVLTIALLVILSVGLPLTMAAASVFFWARRVFFNIAEDKNKNITLDELLQTAEFKEHHSARLAIKTPDATPVQ